MNSQHQHPHVSIYQYSSRAFELRQIRLIYLVSNKFISKSVHVRLNALIAFYTLFYYYLLIFALNNNNKFINVIKMHGDIY